MKVLREVFNKNNFIIFIITLYIFFWDTFLTLNINFDIRIIILSLSFYLMSEIHKDIKNKNFLFIYISILIFCLIVAHSFLVGNLLNKKFFLSITLLLYSFSVVYYFYDIIIENKKKIVYLFVSLFLLSIIIHYFRDFALNPEPVSCGAIKNFFIGQANNQGTPIFLIHFISSYSLIFNENSHLAMTGVGVIVYSIFLMTKDKKLITSDYKNKLVFFILILFIIICFLKSSATLLAGMFFSILTLIIFEYKRLNKYFIICSIILISAITFIFFQDDVCLNKISLHNSNKVEFDKINPFSNKNKVNKEIKLLESNLEKIKKDKDYIIQELNRINNLLKDPEISKDEKIKLLNTKNKILEKLKNFDDKKKQIYEFIKNKEIADTQKYERKLEQRQYRGSLSSDVFYHALKVTINSFFANPFGWGFQGYELAFKDYNKKNNYFRKELSVYNNKDASNMSFKIVTEFGIFSLILYSILLFIFLSKKISIENKVFIMPFIVTQSIRGAGYFNGAFILMLFLLIVIQFKKSETSEK